VRLLAAICLALGFATPAHADWLGFDWGISEEQVQAADSEVEVYRLETVEQKRMRSSTSILGGKWTHDGQGFQVRFFFDPKRRLEFIDIEPDGIQCPELNNLFARHFGKYEETTDSLGPAQRTVRHWRLKRTVELHSLVLHFPGDDTWICSTKIRNPVPWLSR